MPIKRLLRRVFGAAGYFVTRRDYLPYGFRLDVDLRRLEPELFVRVVFDVGANIGEWTTWIKQAFPAATVHGFEPVPETFERYQAATKTLDGVHAHNVALGSRVERRPIFIPERCGLASLVPSTSPDEGKYNEVIVDVTTLDALWPSLGLDAIDVLKIDTEGFDLEVLKGASGLLDSGKVSYVLAECEFHKTEDPHTSFFELYKFMEHCGYHFVALYTELATTELGFVFGLALFAPRAAKRSVGTS